MSNRVEPNQANYSVNPLNPRELNRSEVEYWVSRYAESATGWLSDGKRNLAESCAFMALRYIADARVLGIGEVFINREHEKIRELERIDNLEARMRAQLTSSSG